MKVMYFTCLEKIPDIDPKLFVCRSKTTKLHKREVLGFTLIELLVVVAIVALLSAVVFAALASARQKARDANRIATARSLKLALALYEDKYGSVVGMNGLSASGGGVSILVASGTQSIGDILATEGFLSRKIASDSVFGTSEYYLGVASDGKYDVYAKLERPENAMTGTTISAGADGSDALAAGYNYTSGFGNGVGTAGGGVAASSTGGGGAAVYTGATGVWTSTSVLSGARYYHTSVAANGYIYAIGGNVSGAASADVSYAPLNANGTVGAWTATTPLPFTRYQHSSVVANGYVYVMGGYVNGAESGDVSYAPINANGTIGAWTTTTSLPTTRRTHASVVANGYVYAVGGYAAGSASTNVNYAPLNGDGTIGAWTTTTALPANRYFHSSVASNGFVYVIGGYVLGALTTDVSYAPLNANGTVGAWTATTAFSATRAQHASSVVNGFIYTTGGYVGGTVSTDVSYAPLNANGTIGTWVNTTTFSVVRRLHASVVANGYLYVVGGYAAAGGTTDVSYSLPQ